MVSLASAIYVIASTRILFIIGAFQKIYAIGVKFPISPSRDAVLPDGYSQIFRLYVFGPSGLKDYGSATLRCKIRSLPFLGWWRAGGAVQGKEGIKFCSVA